MAAKKIEMLCIDEVPTHVMINRIIWMEVAMHCSNVMRKRPFNIKKMVVARVRALCRESSVIKRLMKEHKAQNMPHQPPSILDW